MAQPFRLRVGILAVIALAAACAREPVETRYRFMAMGTLVEVTIFDHPSQVAEAAARDVEALFLDLEHRWDPWNDGPLGRLNQALASGESVRPDPDLAAIIGRSNDIARVTGGVFDPAVGSLVKLWGFDDAANIPDQPPSSLTIRTAMDSVRPLPGIWDQPTATLKPAPGVVIDLGGFAKGEAVDRAIRLLQQRDIGNAIVNAGGDLRAIGRRGDRPWRIGVREPRLEGVLAAIEVSGDQSVFTSGDYERFFEFKGRRYHHILDPRTGYPSQGLVSVTVLTDDAATADAACTALMVSGPERWPGVASALGLDKVMVVEASGVIQISAAMKERVRLLREEKPELEIREIP